jgi:hypothetical protein
VASLAALAAAPQSAQAPVPSPPSQSAAETTALVLSASRWTSRFEQGLSGLLFRERYRQKLERGSSALAYTPSDQVVSSTRPNPGAGLLLEANVFLLKAGDMRDYVLFRDVYIANGKEITDHTERLQQLLVDGSGAAIAQARTLTDASARYNVGRFRRNINIPTIAFHYLTPGILGNIRVQPAGADTLHGLPVVMIDFEEIGSPTLVRGGGNGDVPAHGRYWIHPGSGAVLRARVEFRERALTGQVEVELALNDTLHVWVPTQMTDVWFSNGQRVTGLATYDRFQRLAVSTSEMIK